MKFKKVPVRALNSTAELYETQKAIAKLRGQLRVLLAVEADLVKKLEPVYATPDTMSMTDVIMGGMHYTVKYRHVGRDTINIPAVEKFYAKHGKSVPKKHCDFTMLKVVKAKL